MDQQSLRHIAKYAGHDLRQREKAELARSLIAAMKLVPNEGAIAGAKSARNSPFQANPDLSLKR